MRDKEIYQYAIIGARKELKKNKVLFERTQSPYYEEKIIKIRKQLSILGNLRGGK